MSTHQDRPSRAGGLGAVVARAAMAWVLAIAAIAAPARPTTGAEPTAPAGNADRGAIAYHHCVVCHTLEVGQHLTGPSLAGLWGRVSGTVVGFGRYSDALRKAGIVWDARALDRFLADPPQVVPGTVMVFKGLESPAERADLIAYLREVTTGQRAPTHQPGVVSGPKMDLKQMSREHRVASIRYCGDAYIVTTEAGERFPYWEYNLRFKTDSTPRGPARGHPILVPSGSIGDRAYIVFSSPDEISARIDRTCTAR